MYLVWKAEKMLQIDSFGFLQFCNFQKITHDRPTKNIWCHPKYFIKS